MNSERTVRTSHENVCAALEMLLNTMRLLQPDERITNFASDNEDGSLTITITKEAMN